MNKIVILIVLIFFAGYSITSLFVEIPKIFNNIFFGIISILAIYFLIFHFEIGGEIKGRLAENRKKMQEKKQLKSKK